MSYGLSRYLAACSPQGICEFLETIITCDRCYGEHVEVSSIVMEAASYQPHRLLVKHHGESEVLVLKEAWLNVGVPSEGIRAFVNSSYIPPSRRPKLRQARRGKRSRVVASSARVQFRSAAGRARR